MTLHLCVSYYLLNCFLMRSTVRLTSCAFGNISNARSAYGSAPFGSPRRRWHCARLLRTAGSLGRLLRQRSRYVCARVLPLHEEVHADGEVGGRIIRHGVEYLERKYAGEGEISAV